MFCTFKKLHKENFPQKWRYLPPGYVNVAVSNDKSFDITEWRTGKFRVMVSNVIFYGWRQQRGNFRVFTHCRRENRHVLLRRMEMWHFSRPVSLPSNACALPSCDKGTFRVFPVKTMKPPKEERPVMNPWEREWITRNLLQFEFHKFDCNVPSYFFIIPFPSFSALHSTPNTQKFLY